MAVDDPLSALRKLVIGQKSAALPDINAEHPLWPLHQQVQAYDAFVTRAVIHVLGGGRDVQPFTDRPVLDALLQAAAAQPEAAAYRRYLERIDTMLRLAGEVATARQKQD